MGIQGSGLSEKNIRLRFFGLIFCGIIAFGAILYWRQATLTNSEYVQFDIRKNEKRQHNDGTLRSQRYQIDVEETSASVK